MTLRLGTIDLDYFNALEDDVLALSRFVEFTQDNFNTYSIEFVRLLLAAGSEVDVASKALIQTFDPKSKPRNLVNYRELLLGRYPDIAEYQIGLPRFGLQLHPWRNWQLAHPTCWKAYNNVKHDRLKHCREAYLENVLNAVGGLGVLMQYFGESFGLFPKKNFQGTLFRLNLIIGSPPKGWKPPAY